MSSSSDARYRTFAEFYPFYLSEHQNKVSRRLHFIGSSIGLVEIDAAGAPWRIRELMNDGRTLSFEREQAQARWR